MSERATCVVVGGGPAGMVLGLLLARAGVEVQVLEKHADFLRDFRGDTVHPSTLELLDELGLGEQFARLPYSRLDKVEFPVGPDRTVVVADFRRLKLRHPYVAMVPQWDLLDLIADAGEREPAFTLRMRTEVTGLLWEDGRVHGVRYRTPERRDGEIHADLVVACDGRWSLARQQAGLRPREFRVPIDAWWFRLPRQPKDNQSALTPRAGPGRFAVVIPRTDFLQIAYIGRKGTDAELRGRGIESFRRDVADLMPDLADRVDALRSLDEVKHLDVRLNRLNRWHVDGLLCIGDAAHAMSPVGGVGINLAVQDGVAAATLLAGPLLRGEVTGRDLAAVRNRRLLATVVVQALQRMMHRGLVRPILDGRRMGPPKPVLALLRRVPAASYLTAYLIGVGLRPEHAPPSAVHQFSGPAQARRRRPTAGGLRRRLQGHRAG
jgi:2-polyprenyl-6-methoxyphenol hydroxylase-like FAD-dependent oxidoreductase